MVLFIFTNLDDLAVIGAFFLAGYKTQNIIFGQLLGITFLTTLSLLTATVSKKSIPPEWIGFFGFIPIYMGIKELTSKGDKTKEDDNMIKNKREILYVAKITIANGGDNLGICIPFFSTITLGDFVIAGVTFLVMTLVWCKLSYAIVNHVSARWHSEKVADTVAKFLPYLFIALGLYVLWKNGTLDMMANGIQKLMSLLSWWHPPFGTSSSPLH